jgi:acetoin utilization protein AcuB
MTDDNKTKKGSIMEKIFSSNLICVRSGTTVKSAKQIMAEKRIRHLPIVDLDQNIISIISNHDLISHERVQELPVDFFASSPVVFVISDTPLSTIAYKMIEQKISSVVLCNNAKQAVGIITSTDLLLQFANLLKDQKTPGSFDTFKALSTAGEFFRKLSDIGI